MTQPNRASDNLVPPGMRRAAVMVIALCAVTVGVIGALVAHDYMPTGVDNAIWNALPYPWGPAGQSGSGAQLLSFLNEVRKLGAPLPVTLLTCLLSLCCIATRRYRGALLLATGQIAASGLTEFVLKPLVNRTLGGSLSYPSGHTTAAFALAVGVVVLLANRHGIRMPRSLRAVLSLVALGMAALVAFAMVAWHQHYFTDTIAGAAVGTGVPSPPMPCRLASRRQ
jgi:membrane-associated phospholipid phosphatase